MQTINRLNYEEFFLLYADDELDAASKLVVENFIQQNADLAVELEMLMQTKLKPEQLLFDDKESLLRTEGNSINEFNHEEYFLLYLDNELSAAKREEVERYILQHPLLQDEFTTLKQTVLPVENISYGNKEDLYRTAKRRAFYFKPWQFAAAAIFIGVCAVGVWLMQQPAHINIVAKTNSVTQHHAKTNEPSTAVNQPKTNTGITKPVDSIQQTQRQLQQTETIAQQSPSINKTKINDYKAVTKKTDVALPKKNQDEVATNASNQQDEIPAKINDNNIIQPDVQAVTNNDVAIQTLPSNKKTITTSPENSAGNSAGETNNGYKIYNVAYKEIDPNADDNSLHVGAFDLNKNKVKNLLKKAGRLFVNKLNK